MGERSSVTDHAATAPVIQAGLGSLGAAAEGQATERRSSKWLVLATLLVIYIFNFADRYLITGLIGPIKAEFGLDDAFMGLLMGPAFVVLYVVAGVPIARLADRGSRVRIIAIGCMMWSVSTVATGFAVGPISLALARIGVGIGEAAFVAPAYSLLSDYFRPERRGLAFAILGLATYFGQIAGQGGGPALAEVIGWRATYWVVGGPGILLGLLTMILIREPQRTAATKAAAVIPFGEVLRLLLRAPAFLLMMGGFGLSALSGVAFGFWGPELLTRVHAIDPVTAKAGFAINFGLAGLVGMLIFGVLADRLSRRGIVWALRLSAFSIACATTAILLVTWADDFGLAMAGAVPAGLLGGGWSVGFLATLQYMIPDRFRASATALFIAATTLLGYFVGPWVVGVISAALGNSPEALRIALTAVIPLGFVGAGLTWLAVRRVEVDRIALQVGGRA